MFNVKRIRIQFVIIFIWILTNAEQCTTTDSCGTYNYDIGTIKTILTLNNSPVNVFKPILQNIGNVPNSINIQASIWNYPNTIFGVKIESYDKCNGVPRFKSTCCLNKNNSNNCLILGDEGINQIGITFQTAFKCKVTIRAICVGNSRIIDMFEGAFDIDPTNSTNPPTNMICNLQFIKKYDAQYADPNILAQNVCVFNQ